MVTQKLFLALIVMLVLNITNVKAQTTTTTNKYYFEVIGVNSKKEIKEFDAAIKTKAGVKSLKGYGMPRRFFIIETTNSLNKATFANWLPIGVTLRTFVINTLTEEQISLKKIRINQ